MTEIPEHLLKRSRERRSAMGGDGGAADGGGTSDTGGATSADAPAKTTAPAPASMPAHPAPATAEVPPAPSPMVEAYRNRRKIPFWAMPVLAALPLWAYVYTGTLSPPPAGEGPEVLGEELYAGSGCVGCHGAGGGGGVGPAFTGGAIYETFPDFQTHFEWVRLGSAGWLAERGDTYGAPGKPVGGGMPGFGEDQLSDADLIYIILHERNLGGANPDTEDAEALEAVALLMSENPEMTLDEALAEVGVEAPEGGEGGSGADRGDPAPSDSPEQGDTPGSEGESGPGTDAETGSGGSDANQTGSGGEDTEPPQSAGGDSTSP
ncbi:MAG: c-type cytochrome [Acidimicrobiia bacterium]